VLVGSLIKFVGDYWWYCAELLHVTQTLRSNPQKSVGFVIPAQAGIQLVEQFPHSGTKSGARLLRRVFVWLDSRLRGNDGGAVTQAITVGWIPACAGMTAAL